MLGFGLGQISEQVFVVIKSQMPPKMPKRDRFKGLAPLAEIPKRNSTFYDPKGFLLNPKPLKKRSTTTVSREKFLDVVCDGLKKYQYLGVRQRLDLMVACRYILSHFVPLSDACETHNLCLHSCEVARARFTFENFPTLKGW